jgi:hypothetical protein
MRKCWGEVDSGSSPEHYWTNGGMSSGAQPCLHLRLPHCRRRRRARRAAERAGAPIPHPKPK